MAAASSTGSSIDEARQRDPLGDIVPDEHDAQPDTQRLEGRVDEIAGQPGTAAVVEFHHQHHIGHLILKAGEPG